jgi:endonuclease YncB( thermonuclease family)
MLKPAKGLGGVVAILVATVLLGLMAHRLSLWPVSHLDLHVPTPASSPSGAADPVAPNVTKETYSVVRVLDGDTIEVMRDRRTERVRLNGIDCPEKGQPFGTGAKQFTSRLAFGQAVTIRSSGHDRYGRTLGDIVLPDGRSLNQELVRAGMAWWYRQYSKDKTLEDLESEARSQKRGLWSDPHPIAPWEWRRGRRPPVSP